MSVFNIRIQYINEGKKFELKSKLDTNQTDNKIGTKKIVFTGIGMIVTLLTLFGNFS